MLVPLLLSLSFGLGVYLVDSAQASTTAGGPLREFLVRAGLPGVTPRDSCPVLWSRGVEMPPGHPAN